MIRIPISGKLKMATIQYAITELLKIILLVISLTFETAVAV